MVYVDIVFIIVFSLYLWWLYGLLRALKSDAPYVPMTPTVVNRMMDMVEPVSGARWIDLGSGDGRILIAAAKKFDITGTGIERISAFRILSRVKIFFAGLFSRITIRSGDFLQEDLSKYDVISSYLLPEVNTVLVKKITSECKPGTLVVFHRFPLEGLSLIAEDSDKKIYIARV